MFLRSHAEPDAVIRHVCITGIANECRDPAPRFYQKLIAKPLEQKAENPPMWYGSTKSLLESIVRWLRTEALAPQDDTEWQAQTDLVQVCLTEMVETVELTVNLSKGATSRYVHRPVADKLNRAMPHVRAMLTAMRDRDPTMALAHGETTLRRL
jgi:hypothetical protein